MGGGLHVFLIASDLSPSIAKPPPPSNTFPAQSMGRHEASTHLRLEEEEEEECPGRQGGVGGGIEKWGRLRVGEGGGDLACQGASLVERWGFSS